MFDFTDATVTAATEAYLATAAWSSSDEEGRNLDDIEGAEWSPAAEAKAREVVEAFLADAADAVVASGLPAQAIGHNLWLTAAGHGAGFWDLGLPGDLGRRLTKVAKTYPMEAYVGDDGALHIQ